MVERPRSGGRALERARPRGRPIDHRPQRRGRRLNPSDIPTQPIWRAHTVMNTTDQIILPSAVLLEEAGARRPAPAAPPAAGLDGYEFLSCLDRAPLGEIWLVRAPDGRTRVAH